jgi:hypothetical protein
VIVVSLRLGVGVMAALGLALLLEWTLPDGGGDAAPVAALRLARGAPKTPLIERAAANWAETILARPLFSASRRPPRVAAGARDDSAPDEARLSGIMISRFGRRAIFAPAGGGKPLVLGEGAQVNQSTIRSISPDRVVLASGTVLVPAFDKNRVPTAYTPPFQPPVPNFPNAPFVNGNIPNGGFALPRMPQPPQIQPQEAQPGQPGDGQAVPPAPPFRGPIIPNRRE